MSKEIKRPTKQEAYQRHFDYYVVILMNETNEEKLELEFLQIALAVRRMKAEDVGSLKYQPGNVETKYLALAGGFVPKQLRKLIEGTATKEDAQNIELAIEAVELGEVEYPANISFLKNMLRQLELHS